MATSFIKTFGGFSPDSLMAMVNLFGDNIIAYSIKEGWYTVEFSSEDVFVDFLTKKMMEAIGK